MRKINLPIFLILSSSLFLLACSNADDSKNDPVKKYIPASQELYDTIAHMDSILFDAFNSRNLEKLKTFL